MAGFDKYVLMEKLKKLGWKEGGDGYEMEPPPELFEKRPRLFHVYDAKDLQNLLGEEVPEET